MNDAIKMKGTGEGKVGFHLLCGGVSHLISVGIAFFLTPFLIGRLGIETYGFYPIALEAMAVIGLLMGVLSATANRYVAVEYMGERRAEAGKYLSTVFFSSLGLFLLLLAPAILFVVFSDSLLDMPVGQTGQIKGFLALMMGAAFLDAVTAVLGASYETTGRLDLRAAQELATVLVKGSLLWFLLSGVLPISVISVGAAVLASSFVGALFRIFMARHLIPDILPRREQFSGAALRRVLASGTWYSVNELGGWLIGGGLLLLVNRMLGAAEAGVYSLALTASRVVCGVMMVAAGVFVPTLTRQFAKGDRAALLREILRCERLVGLFALVGVSMTVGFLREFLEVWLSAENTPLLRLLTVMAIIPILSVACALPFFHLAVVMDRVRKMALLYLAGALLGVAAAIAAVFLGVGILGVAAVSFGCRVLWFSVFMPLYAARLLGVEPLTLFTPVVRTYVGAALSVVLIFALKGVCRMSSPLAVFIVGAVSLCAVLAVGFFAVYAKNMVDFGEDIRYNSKK